MTLTQIDVELVSAFWRLRHAAWADKPDDEQAIRAEIDALLEQRQQLTAVPA